MTDCVLCGSKEFSILYQGKIRKGVFRSQTSDSHEVIKCKGCGLVRLKENPLSMAYYQSEEYREDYNETSEASSYIEMHDNEQGPRLDHIGADKFRDKLVLDYGCGGGAFLDLISGLSSSTLGIEPFTGFHKSLNSRGHSIYASKDDALKDFKGEIDTIVSFGVLEHIEDPLDYLIGARSLLKEGGQMFLETDNFDDILLKINPNGFEEFFYRTAHLWYFQKNTLSEIAKKAGFSKVHCYYRHNYDLSNTILWTRDSEPTGLNKLPFLDERINTAWKDFLESSGQADLVCLTLEK